MIHRSLWYYHGLYLDTRLALSFTNTLGRVWRDLSFILGCFFVGIDRQSYLVFYSGYIPHRVLALRFNDDQLHCTTLPVASRIPKLALNASCEFPT
jgi:hypothetical protein